MNQTTTTQATDSQARHAAKKIGVRAIKSRSHISLDNFGGYMLQDPITGGIVKGCRYELSTDDGLSICHQ
mgnify:FL=1